jgi:hypothetical protein
MAEIMPPDMALNRLLTAGLRHQDYHSRESVIAALKKSWDRLPMETVRATIDAVPLHLGKIIAAGGHPIK